MPREVICLPQTKNGDVGPSSFSTDTKNLQFINEQNIRD